MIAKLCIYVASVVLICRAAAPNFLFLLVDDWGFGDIDACPDDMPYEHCPLKPKPGDKARASRLQTPRMKQLAREGMIMTNWYAPRSVCSPSRAAMMAGRDVVRFHFTGTVSRLLWSSGSRGGMPTEETTVAEYLKRQGYSTGYAGKWHLGLTNGTNPFHFAPWNSGFDEVDYFLDGSNGAPCPVSMSPDENDDDEIFHECTYSHIYRRLPGEDRGEIIEQPIRWENTTASQTLAALEFIERHKADPNPWFFMLAFTSVHVPWVLNRQFVTDPAMKFWTDMVGEVDWAVGAIMDHLKTSQQENNTVILLTGDNGAFLESAATYCPSNCKYQNYSFEGPSNFGCTYCNPSHVSSSGPYSGGKGMTWEGGHRVPALWRWPGHIPAGSVNPIVSSGMDFLPTAVAIAGGKVDEDIILDGQDISASLLSPQAPSESKGSFAYWCGTRLMAVRLGRHKVTWFGQKWLTGKDIRPGHETFTSPDACGGTGTCCPGAPLRMCACFSAYNFSDALTMRNYPAIPDMKGFPFVNDLLDNPSEDFKLRLDPDNVTVRAIIADAESFRMQKLLSVCKSLGLSCHGDSPTAIEEKLSNVPTQTEVDFCVGDQSMAHLFPEGMTIPLCPEPWAKKEKRIPELEPYNNCNHESTDDTCKARFPCCEDDSYAGPWEYEVPKDGKQVKCGCFKRGSSHFPETSLLNSSSVQRWQLLHQTRPWERGHLCKAGDTSAGNVANCNNIYKYGLNNVPTGWMWNEPYCNDETCGAEPGPTTLTV